MFDFQKLDVYKKSKELYVQLINLNGITENKTIGNQLQRAALSVPLNIAEGTGKFSVADRRNYYITARASLFECAAIIDILLLEGKIDQTTSDRITENCDQLSRMLFQMIKTLQK